MHPNTAFRKPDRQHNIAFARHRSFGTLALNADQGPLMSHVPFQLDPSGETLELHLVRSNPILRQVSDPVQAVIAVNGADSFISPDWYAVPDQVPTWNYIAVHLRGTLTRLPQDQIRGVIDRLSADFESRLAPKPPWTSDKMAPDVLDKMMRMIVPLRMQVSDISGTWKLNQNKDDAVRKRAAEEVAQNGIGSELDALAALMRNPPTET